MTANDRAPVRFLPSVCEETRTTNCVLMNVRREGFAAATGAETLAVATSDDLN